MRKDFDYVEMHDYDADMADLSGQAANIIGNLTQELAETKRDRNRMFVAAVIASGGRLEIRDSHLMKAHEATIKSWRDEASALTTFEIES